MSDNNGSGGVENSNKEESKVTFDPNAHAEKLARVSIALGQHAQRQAGTLRNEDGDVVTDPNEIAALLATGEFGAISNYAPLDSSLPRQSMEEQQKYHDVGATDPNQRLTSEMEALLATLQDLQKYQSHTQTTEESSSAPNEKETIESEGPQPMTAADEAAVEDLKDLNKMVQDVKDVQSGDAPAGEPADQEMDVDATIQALEDALKEIQKVQSNVEQTSQQSEEEQVEQLQAGLHEAVDMVKQSQESSTLQVFEPEPTDSVDQPDDQGGDNVPTDASNAPADQKTIDGENAPADQPAMDGENASAEATNAPESGHNTPTDQQAPADGENAPAEQPADGDSSAANAAVTSGDTAAIDGDASGSLVAPDESFSPSQDDSQTIEQSGDMQNPDESGNVENPEPVYEAPKMIIKGAKFGSVRPKKEDVRTQDVIVARHVDPKRDAEAGVKMSRYNLNYVFSEPDDRDHKFGLIFGDIDPKYIPSSSDLRTNWGSILDQLDLGSCVSNSVSYCVRYTFKKQNMGDFTPSRLFIYFNGRMDAGYPLDEDSGMTIRDGYKSVAHYSVCSEDLWGYVPEKFAERPSSNCYDAAKQHKTFRYINLDNDPTHIKKSLKDGFPVSFGAALFESFMSADTAKNGNVPVPKIDSEQRCGGHAMTIVGHDDDKNIYIVANNWGENWGDKGFCYIPYDYMHNDDLCGDFWSIRTFN